MRSGRERQAEIYLGGARGRRPAVPVDPARLEEAARAALSPEAFAYLAGGAGSEATIRANREALDRRRLVPRMLRGSASRDLGLELFGRRLPVPFALAPLGALELARPRGDLLAARAAAAEGVPFVFSSQASVAMEECAAAMGDAPRWFQLYWGSSDELAASFVRRAEACGCDAIVLALDVTTLGWRPRDLDLAHLPFLAGRGLAQHASDPVFLRLLEQTEAPPAGRPNLASLRSLLRLARAYPGSTLGNVLSSRPRAAVRLFLETFPRPELSWDDVSRLREWTSLPVVLKGMLHADDAREAVERGVDAIVVSNHGGRQVDGAVASLDALPAVVDAVAGRVPVLVDGGIRGGADVVKALALGARGVLVGRPYAYGLALAGEAGVRDVIANLAAELELTLALTGCASLADVGPELLAPGAA
jgi:lactate 2-monooxygenase